MVNEERNIVTGELVSLWFELIRDIQQVYDDRELFPCYFERLLDSIVDTKVCMFKKLVDKEYKRLFDKYDAGYRQWCCNYPYESKREEWFDDKKLDIRIALYKELLTYIIRLIASKVY